MLYKLQILTVSLLIILFSASLFPPEIAVKIIFIVLIVDLVLLLIRFIFPPTNSNSAREPKLSICLKCGGLGQETASNGKMSGFRCKDCKSFWKEKNY